MEKTLEDVFGPVISSYSRAQAIEDGVLVDVSGPARELGFKFPVAVTCGVWASCVEVPKSNHIESEDGRLHDVLWMLKVAIRISSGGDRVEFRVRVGKRVVNLYSVCGPGDDMAPVITIMLEGED